MDNKEQLVRDYYSRLKRLPSFKVVVGLGAVETALAFLRGLQLGVQFFEALITYLILGLALYLRHWKFAIFVYDATAFLYLIFSFTPIQPIYALGILLPLTGYVLIAYTREFYVYLVMTVQGIVPSLIFGFLLIYVAYIGSIIAFFAIYIHMINRKGLELHGTKSLDLVRPFVKGIMNREYEVVDRIMGFTGKKVDVIVALFKIGEKVFVLPKLHYGLFGQAGSSMFPYDLERACPQCVSFHGPGSHELDAVSREESMKIVKAVADYVASGNWKDESFRGIEIWQKGRMKGITLLFQGKSLTFLTRPGWGIDDLPETLWDYSYGTGDFLIDTHSERLKDDITFEDVKDIKKALEEIKATEERPLFFAYKEGVINAECEGLCDKRVRVFAFSDGRKKIGVVYIYANNSHEDLGKALKDVEGYDEVVLVTPDDHTCTGTLIGSLYNPAVKCDDLVGVAKSLLREALSDLKPTSVQFGMVKVNGIRVLGETVSQLLTSLEFVGAFVKKTYWMPLVFPLVSLVIALLFQTYLGAP